MTMLPVAEAQGELKMLGFERLGTLHGSTFKDCSTIIVVPTRGSIHHLVVQAWQSMCAPMNQKRAFLFAAGHEVGEAYNALVQNILNDKHLSKWKYLMTMEDDNLPPPDAHVRLLETIQQTGCDGVSGLYFTKGDVNMPMAYGNPDEFRRTGELDFKPMDVRAAVQLGAAMEVNGIAMGCSLYRMDLFREIPEPWFETVSDWWPEHGARGYTQDLKFAEKAKRRGKKFYVDCRVKVGHLDVETGICY
jgi:hypothetical protein